MKYWNLLIAFLLCTFLIVACKPDDDTVLPTGGNTTTTNNNPDDTNTSDDTSSDDTSSDDMNDGSDDYVVETIVPTGEEQFLNLDSDYIFNQKKLHTFEINLPAASLAKLDADPAAEEYVEAALTFEGETVSPVGLRYKGSIGGFGGCLSNTDWTNPSGYKTCTKLSMKIKINWDGVDTKFYGLKKVQLHSMNHDESQMRDRLAYWLFAEMGVPAPRATHARVVVNGEYVGLFALIENIDGRFAKHHFDDDDGNVYKEIWPVDMDGNPQSDATYIEGLKTNEEEADISLMKSFGEAIAASTESTIQSVISNRMNIDEIISYAVVDRTIRHDDGPFHWYCSWGGCTNHNYFWYEEPNNKELHLIPWDMDLTFENIIWDVNPVIPLADDWGETSNNCNPFSYGAFGFYQWSAACDKLTGGWAMYEEEYIQKKEEFIATAFSEAKVTARLDAWSAQIRAATIEADEAHGDSVSEAQWESAVEYLKELVAHAREN